MSVMKTCTKCKLEKPLDAFFLDKRRGVPRAACKSCCSEKTKKHYAENKEYFAEYAKNWRAANREQANASSNRSRAKRRRGIHDRYAEQQNGKCGICCRPIDDSLQAHLDHDHRTGAIRELLCKRCNYMIGMADDDEAVLQRGIAYLRKHNADPTREKLYRKSAWWTA